MLRHEQQTVCMAMAAALHHSAGPREKVEKQQNGAPRGQKTAARAREGVEHVLYEGLRAPLPGKRPGLPPEPEPRGGAVTVGYVAAPAPPLAVPLLASAAGEAVDHSTLQFLLKHAIETKKALEEEEVEEAVARLRAKVHAGEPLSASEHAAWYGTSSSSTGKRRKKKKRKRRKLPKAPLPRCGRPCDLQRQVPAALRVLRVPRQNGGHSCSATETGTHSVLLGPGAVLGQGRCARVAQRQRYGQTVQKTVLAPQFAVHRRSTASLRAAEANPHGPACSENHRDSAVAVGQVVDAPVVQVVPYPLSFRQVLMVQTLQKTVEVPQMQLFCGCGRSCDMQRQVPGFAGRCLRPVHRQDVQVLRRGDFAAFCGIFRTPSAWT